MEKYTFITKNNLFGMLFNDIEIIPCTHSTKEDAIEEFVYFETLNTNSPNNKRFLYKTHTIEEIENIKNYLLTQ